MLAVWLSEEQCSFPAHLGSCLFCTLLLALYILTWTMYLWWTLHKILYVILWYDPLFRKCINTWLYLHLLTGGTVLRDFWVSASRAVIMFDLRGEEFPLTFSWQSQQDLRDIQQRTSGGSPDALSPTSFLAFLGALASSDIRTSLLTWCSEFYSSSFSWDLESWRHVCMPSCSVVSDSLQPHARHLCAWYFPGKNTGVGCHFLLQGFFLTQGSKPHLLHWQADFTTEPPGKHIYVYIIFWRYISRIPM